MAQKCISGEQIKILHLEKALFSAITFTEKHLSEKWNLKREGGRELRSIGGETGRGEVGTKRGGAKSWERKRYTNWDSRRGYWERRG